MRDSAVHRPWQRQLALVLRMLVESTERWPTGLLITFEGPTLQVDDKVLFVRLLERADDAGVARVARPLDESTWNGMQRCMQRLADSSILLRGFGDDELQLRMIESHRQDDEEIEVTFNRHLLATWRSGESKLDQMLQAFRPEVHGGEFPAGDELADDSITGLRQVLAGQVVPDEELDRALGARSGLEDLADQAQGAADRAGALIDAAMESVESSNMRIAAMRSRAAVLEVPLGKIKSFGPFGPRYEVGEPLRQLEDGDWLISVTLVASGGKEQYRLSKLLEDPDAQ